MSIVGKPLAANKREDIPIAIDTEEVMKLWLTKAYEGNLSKVVRYALLPKIIEKLADMIASAYAARFNKEERVKHLDRYLHDLQCVKSYTRVIHESGCLSHGRSHHLFEKYEKMSKQAMAWRSYTR